MIPRWLAFALFAVVFAPGLLHAQPKAQDFNAFVFGVTNLNDATNNDKMYEDIEILRRILDRKLHGLYPQGAVSYSTNASQVLTYPANNPYFPQVSEPNNWLEIYNNNGTWQTNPTYKPLNNWWVPSGTVYWTAPSQESRSTIEGVYLKGQGIVYTATLSSFQTNAKTETAKPVSEWESVRRQLRNEKEEPKKTDANKPLHLSDVLLKVLAENGHHFSQLGENESLTLVITVHGTSSSSSPAKSAGQSTKTESKPATSSGTAHQSQVRSLELLGDLHLKQGQYEEAIKAFQKAVDHKGLESKVAASLYRKLAQCYLAVERMEDAQTALNEAAKIMKNAKEAAANKNKLTNAAKPSAPTLPVKLIISAPKKLLDEAKEGKLSFEEFRRRASVETLRFDNRRSHD